MKIIKCEAGAALLEFSLLAPLVILMFVGVVDFGTAISQAMTVEDAARAGAYWGTLPGNGGDISGMQTQAINASNNLAGFTAVATRWCSCTPGGAVSSCTSYCGSNIPIKYVQVNTNATVQALAGYPGISTSFALTGLSILRIQ